jgi:hypothetical protein
MCAELTSMGCPDPEQAILDKLAGPLGAWEPGSRSAGGWQSGFVRGGNAEQADLATVRFVKHRQSELRHVYFVTFKGTHPRLGPAVRNFDYVYVVEPVPEGGWRAFGGAGGTGDPPRRSTPWVNLGGGGWPKWFFAGGWIDAAGQPAERIELRFADGLTLDDDATEDVALFITDEHVTMPATIAMLDAEGNEIATHPAFPGLD